MPRKRFREDDDEILIKEIKGYHELYDNQHKDFRNSNFKQTAWRKVAYAVKKDVEECKKRWKDIRDNYFKILRKTKLSTGSGVIPVNHKWALFEKLQFLSNVKDEKASSSNVNMVNDSIVRKKDSRLKYTDKKELDFGDKISLKADLITSTRNLSSKSLKRRHSDDLVEFSQNQSDCTQWMNNKIVANEEDDVDLFMKSIAISIKKLPNNLITQAKLEILSTISHLEAQTYPDCVAEIVLSDELHSTASCSPTSS